VIDGLVRGLDPETAVRAAVRLAGIKCGRVGLDGLGEAAARLGFDWPSVEGALEKVEEEWQELRRALTLPPDPAWEEELGDLLFALVNVARFLKIDSENALRRTVYKFIKRFHVVERTLAKEGKTPESATLEEMEDIWQAAKRK
jgi:uncharacterized protein YabN with tetrapyrrole methylase and pyrophosphatase domain